MRLIGLRRACPTAALSVLAFFWVVGALDAQPAREQPRFGGVLKVAMIGEPPSLDRHWSVRRGPHQLLRAGRLQAGTGGGRSLRDWSCGRCGGGAGGPEVTREAVSGAEDSPTAERG